MARSWRVATVGAIVVSLVGFGAPAFAATPDAAVPQGEARDNLIDKIVTKAEPDLMEVLVTRLDAEGSPTFQTVEVDSKADARSVVGRLLGASDVVGVEMNQFVEVAHHKKKCRKFKKKPAKYNRCLQRHAHGAPDPLLPQQWALGASYLDFASVSAITAGDTRRPVVAIIDTGISAGHPDLAGRVIAQANFVAGQSVLDQCGHGTHVAGIVGATANNGIGIAGLSQTALLQSVKVLGSDCSGSLDAVAKGIVWAVNNGASVLNLSIESTGSSAALDAAVRYALDNQRVVVAAAGNGNTSCGLLGARCTYPA
ncbi:MAG TPA: S8 family serine peptidase, partial [Aeromicrobium sp.]|nr:S8 family serine peptidase [Aeromicrobium sp.]